MVTPVRVVLVLCVLFIVGCGKTPGHAPDSGGAAATPAKEASSLPAPSPEAAEPGSGSGGSTAAGTEKTPTYQTEPRAPAGDSESGQELLSKADSARRSSDYKTAADLYSQAMMADPTNHEIPYRSALNYADWGKSDLAIESLGVAADMGYSDSQAVAAESKLDGLRENPRFAKIVKRIEGNR